MTRRSATILRFPAATTPAASSAATADKLPPAGVAAPFREWLDPATLPADDRPDIGEWLRSRAVPEPVTTPLPVKMVLAAVWLVLAVYCAAIAVGAVR